MCYTSLPLEVAKVVHSLSRHKISFFSSLRRLQARHAWHPSRSKGHPNAGEPWVALEYGPRNTVLPCQSRKPTEAGGGSVLSAQHAVASVCVGERSEERCQVKILYRRPDATSHSAQIASHRPCPASDRPAVAPTSFPQRLGSTPTPPTLAAVP